MNRKDFRPNETTSSSRTSEQPTKPKKEVIDRFLEGKGSKTANKSISSDGKTLKSYDTVIAVRQENGKVLVNDTKYSSTTSSQQNYLKSRLEDTNTEYETTSGHQRGYKGEETKEDKYDSKKMTTEKYQNMSNEERKEYDRQQRELQY